MLMFVEKTVFRTSFNVLRRFSVALESTISPRRINDEDDEDFIDHDKEFTQLRRDDVKSLRVAIIGLPNVGKSTLINRLTHRHVCPTAARVHVTRAKTNAVLSHEDTQLVFIDTPGLVSAHEFKKFKMEETFRTDAIGAMSSADIVGVVQDASNKYTRGIIHDRILELMKMCRVGVPSILILNKIDSIKRKRELLSLTHSLTSDKGWPNFSDVFMVSALKADGIDDLRNYLLDSAKLRDWDYDSNVITDQKPEKLMELTIRAKLMDCLPNEVPYSLQVEIEHLNTCEDGSMNCIAIVHCPSDRISKLVLGRGGSRIKAVALESEEQLSNAFRTQVRVKVAVKFVKDKDEQPFRRE